MLTIRRADVLSSYRIANIRAIDWDERKREKSRGTREARVVRDHKGISEIKDINDMSDGELTYDEFMQRLDIQDVLLDAGYQLNKRDGLRYPSYVMVGSDGRRVRGDKFIVTQNGKCCFQPPEQKVYNVISFIKEHPYLFADHKAGMSPDRLVNLVCNRLLNQPRPERTDVRSYKDYELKPFNIEDRYRRLERTIFG